MTVVLAPVDGSTRALHAVPWAEKLAGPDGTVVLLRVVPPQPDYAESLFSLVGAEDRVQEIQDTWARTAKADMDEAEALLSGSGVTVEQMVAEGEPDEEIVAAAARRGVQMIAMASHGRGRVARTAPVPVLILRTPDEDVAPGVTVSRIVVPLDGSEIAARALPVASELAEHLTAPVHVIRAVDAASSLPMASGVFGAGPVIDANVTDQIWEEAEAEARSTVTAAVSRLQSEGVEASGGIVNGS